MSAKVIGDVHMTKPAKCPYHAALRKDLPPLTARMAKLPVDDRGYPVPFFVAWVNGKPEFQLADAEKRKLCKIQKLCWVCGEKLAGERKAFVIGPMCAINRVTAEPPSHLECCEWSVKGCPFLAKPKMVRRESEAVEKYGSYMPGMAIMRNPGVMVIWETLRWHYFDDGKGDKLIRIGDPMSLSWWREGRPAHAYEIIESVNTGLPALIDACQGDLKQLASLHKARSRMLEMLPKGE